MNTLSLNYPARLPRIWLLLIALLLPHLALAGYFYTPYPATATVGSGTSGTWAGTVSMTVGTYAHAQVKAPGSSTWTNVGSGVSTHYGAAYVSYGVTFSSAGTWEFRIYVPSSGSVAEYRTTVVN